MSEHNKKGIKSRALLFHTPNEAEFKKVKIKDGTFIIDNKEFDVSKIKAVNLKSGTGTRPLYIVSWRSLIPASFEERTDEISYAPTGDSENDGKNYLSFVDKLKKSGHSGKNIESNKWTHKSIVSISPKFLKTKYDPQLFRETAELRFLKNMKSYSDGKRGGGANITYIILAFAGGIGWAIMLLVLMGYLKL